jgi:hypothetical protein
MASSKRFQDAAPESRAAVVDAAVGEIIEYRLPYASADPVIAAMVPPNFSLSPQTAE